MIGSPHNSSLILKGKLFCAFFLAFQALAFTQNLKIMPLGDSITRGHGGSTPYHGYRDTLANTLSANGVSFDFVGSRKDGDGSFDIDHEGIPGAQTADILDSISTFIQMNDPDMVLIHLGTNDITQGRSNDLIIANLGVIIDSLRNHNRATKILIGGIIPRTDDAQKDAQTEALNGRVLDLVNQKKAAGYKIWYVDHYTAFKSNPNWKTDLISDGVHPNDAGYVLMANTFYAVIQNALNSAGPTVVDDFNRPGPGLGTNWDANIAFQIVNNQLSNTDSNSGWVLATWVANANPEEVSFRWANNADARGINEGGLAMRLETPAKDANGYLVWLGTSAGAGKKIFLWTIENGAPAQSVTEKAYTQPEPAAGDTFRVRIGTDASGHYFDCYVNSTFYGRVSDPNELKGNTPPIYAGIMLNGGLNNDVDDFNFVINQDNLAPSAVADLTVTSVGGSTATLQWTAPGDDGDTGTASQYEIRYSTSPIDATNFSSATLAANPPVPTAAGTIQTLTITGLNTGTLYYFRMKARDDAGNVSDLSNQASATTSSGVATVDNFNRASLGPSWAADPAFQIVNNELHNTSTVDSWNFLALYKEKKNPIEVAFTWGQTADAAGIDEGGFALMMDAASTTANGYLLFRRTVTGTIELWTIENGAPATFVKNTQGALSNPGAADQMSVALRTDGAGHHFDLYINGQLDGTVTDTQKRQGNGQNLYAGVMLKGNRNNPIDDFKITSILGSASRIVKVSGDNQKAPIGQKLPQPLVVEVTDNSGNPIEGSSVLYSVSQGDGSLATGNTYEFRVDVGASQPYTDVSGRIWEADKKYVLGSYGYTSGNAGFLDVPIAGTEDDPLYQTERWNIRGYKVTLDNGDYTVFLHFAELVYTQAGKRVFDVSIEGSKVLQNFDPFAAAGAVRKAVVKSFPVTVTDGVLDIDFQKRVENPNLFALEIVGTEGIVVTDASGRASREFILGNTIGTHKVRVTAVGFSAPAVEFTATATAGAAKSVLLVSGDGQSGTPGQALPQPFVVEVRDSSNNPVADYPVYFFEQQGGGTFDVEMPVMTGADGRASASYTLGNQSSTQKIHAQAGNLAGSPVVFTATATSGVASKILIVSGNNQSGAVGSTLANPLVARVVDGGNSAVPDYPVDFQSNRGGGSASRGSLLKNGGLEGTYYSQPQGRGMVAPSWGGWNNDDSETHSQVQGYNSSSAQRLNTMGSATGASISQRISKSPAHGTKLYLSFYYKATGDVTPAMRVVLRATLDNVLKRIPLPATGGQWVHVGQYFNWDQAVEPLEIHLLALDNVIVDLDNIYINYLTDAQGQISTNWTLGDSAMVQEMQAVANAGGQHLINSPLTYRATATAGPASKLVMVGGNNQVGSASQPLSNPFEVRVEDDHGNPKSGHPVTFSVTKGGGKLNGTLTTYNTTTNAQGVASAVLTLGPSTGQTNEVQVTAERNGVNLTGSPMTFQAIAAVPAKMVKLSGDNQQGSASLPLDSPLKVQITDAQDRPISGFAVTFSVTQGGGTINGKSTEIIKTLGNGEAAATLVMGLTPGIQNKVTVTAMFNGSHLAGSPMTFTANAADLSRLVMLDGNGQSGTVGTELGQFLKAKVIDNLSNGIKGWPVDFQVIAGGGKLDGSVSGKTVVTDSLGIAKVRLTLGAQPDTNKVRASSNYQGQPLTGSPLTFYAVGRVGSPVAIKKAGGDNQRGVVGSPLPEPLKVKVVDAQDNGIEGHLVTFEVKTGGGSIDGKNTENVLTNADGIAQVTLTLGTTVGEGNNRVEARAFNGGTPLDNSPLIFMASATNTTARNLLYVGGNRQEGLAGAALPQPISVRVTDLLGNVVSGHPVVFAVKKGGGTVGSEGQTQVVVATNDNGVASTTWTLGGVTRPDSQIVEASSTDGQVGLNGSPIKFVGFAKAGSTSPTQSLVQATGPVPADGSSLSQVTIYLRDNFGNPVIGHFVHIRVSGSGNAINHPIKASDAEGKVTGSFSSTRAERKTVTAFDLNAQVEITNGTTVDFTALSAAKLVMGGGNDQVRNTGTALAEPLSAMVTDMNGNPVPNHPVRFEVESGGGYILEMQPVRSDSSGLARITYVLGPNPGLNIIKAYAVNLDVPPVTFNATARSNSAAQMAMVSGNEQTGVAGEDLPAPVVVQIDDANGDPIFNYPVKFRVTFGGGSVMESTEATINTDAFGLAKMRWKLGDAMGPNVLWAEAPGLQNSPQIFTANGTSGPAVDLVMVDGDGQTGVVGQQAPRALTVKVTDGRSQQGNPGNPVSGVVINFELISGTGSLSAPQSITSGDGTASVNLTFGNEAGERIVRAYSDGLIGSPVSFSVYARAAAPKTMAIHDGNDQSGTINKPLSRPIRVLVLDRFGNPVPGAQVNFVITAGGGSFVESQPVKTNDRGIAATTWILGPNVGENRAWAVMQGVTNSPLNFVATASTNNFPVFEPVAPMEITELQQVEFEIKATDADEDAITYGARNLPSGAAFDSLGSHVFSWTTDYEDAGVHELIFTARDSKGGTSELLVTITVKDLNRAPVLVNWQPAARDVDVTGGNPKTFQILAVDPDGEQLSYLWYLDGKHVGSNSSYVFQPVVEGSFGLEARAFDRADTVSRSWNLTVGVDLISFAASSVSGKGVTLRWITANEFNHAGFNILRSERRAAGYEQINSALIRPDGSGSYQFKDATVEAGTRYYYLLEDVSISGQTERHGPVMIELAVPEKFALSQNYPNPFNPSTNLRFDLPRAASVTLRIYNTLGQEIRTLVNSKLPAGVHTVLWDGRDNRGLKVSSGIYYYRLQAGSFSASRKMLLVK